MTSSAAARSRANPSSCSIAGERQLTFSSSMVTVATAPLRSYVKSSMPPRITEQHSRATPCVARLSKLLSRRWEVGASARAPCYRGSRQAGRRRSAERAQLTLTSRRAWRPSDLLLGLRMRTAGEFREEAVMAVRKLPDHPDVDHLRGEARALQRRVRSGHLAALDTVRALHPAAAEPTAFRLADAQLVVARGYGFASWPRLRRHLQTIARYTRSPQRQPVGEQLRGPDDLADEFLRLACLVYGGDDVGRHRRARELLAAHPGIARHSIHTMAAVGDVGAARTLLASDPAQARREGGPYAWEPLLYLAYSRLDSGRLRHSTLDVARLLLGRGAD